MTAAARAVLVAFIWSAAATQAAEVPVAVAANFTEPAKRIAVAFKAATGDDAILSFGSSGQFYTQISQGAPYEVFLSADVERAQKAEAAGVAVAGTRFVYATGRLALFSRTPGLVDPAGAVLRAPLKFDKIAIADPAVAPYGAAAIETMTKLGVLAGLKPHIVQGASITQAFEFTTTGAAELGFVALSQAITQPAGSRWIVPQSLHAPIDQAAVLLIPGDKDPAARAFLAFLKRPRARAIIKHYGYEVR